MRWKRISLWLIPVLLAGAGLALSLPGVMNAARAAGEPVPLGEGAVTQMAYGFRPLGDVAVYRPATIPRGVVIALSDAEGWDETHADMANRLAEQGALVAGVSTPAFLKALNAGRRCINPNYAIIALARDLQHRLQLPSYDKPVIIGRGEGAALAYAALVSGPNGAYKAVLSEDFAPVLAGSRPWCRSGSLKVAAITRPHRGWAFAPSRRLPSPWVVVAQRQGAALRRFVSRTRGGRIAPDNGGPDNSLLSQTMAFLAARLAGLQAALPPGLPLNIVTDPAARRTDMMAVLYSGDGGWVGLDKDVAGQLAHAGIPVVGIDSLSYFWSQRTPAGAAADLGAVIRGYSAAWRRPRVLLVGYSFGADVLPYIVGRLPPELRARVDRMSLLGLSPAADFQFHLSSWLDMDSTRQYPTLPAVERLRGLSMLCIRGAAENDSACPSLPHGTAQMVVVPGGHHFGRNAPLLVNHMLKGLTI